MYPHLVKIFSFLSLLLFQAYSQCLFNSSPIESSPFPDRTYLSYESSIKFILANYFSGINLTFSYSIAGSSGIFHTEAIPKTLQYTEGNLTENLPQIAHNPIIDIYWDDSNVTSVNQQWTTNSLLLLLTGTESNYTVIAGSLDSIQASNRSQVPLYSSISIQLPPNASQNSTLQCSRIAPVGQLEYYIDCALIEPGNNGTSTIFNYFYYLVFPSYPPLPQNISAVPILSDNMTGSSSPPISSRVIESSTNGTETYLIRYYNGLQLANPIAASSVIEVFNVTSTSSPNLLFTYNSSSPGFYPNFNISSVKLSPYYMYVTSAQGDILMYQLWYMSPPTLFQQYNYAEMSFLASTLRVESFGGNTKESFLAIGSLNSVNLTALLFVSQTYQAIFMIPVPSFQQTTLYFQAFSITLGEDFFGLSYSVSNPSSNSPCYYFAIGDITTSLSSDCHTLWPFTQSNYITYARMNPAANTDIFFMLGKDNQYSNYSIFRPAFWLMNMNETSQGFLTVDSSGNQDEISFEVVVLEPNDQSIYLDLDSSDELQNVAYQMNSNYIMFLNQSIYGPELNYALESEDIATYSTYISHSVENDFTLSPGGSFFSCRRKGVGPGQSFLLIENTTSGFVMKIGNVNFTSPFNLASVSMGDERLNNLQIFDYYFVSGFEVLLYLQNGTQYMLLFNLQNYFTFNESLQDYFSGYMTSNMSLQLSTPNFVSIVVMERPDGNIQVLSVDNTTLYIYVFPNTGVEDFLAGVSTTNFPFPSDPPFLPAKIAAHPAYPNLAFITTINANITYIIDFAGMVIPSLEEQTNPDNIPENYVVAFDIIFARHPADSYLDVIVQPFTNNLFYIFPLLNVIEQWDLSLIKSPFFTKNLELHSYNLTVLASPFVQRGHAFSSTTDTLYLLAIDNNTTNLYVLVLKPNIANSYIVDAIQLSFEINNPQNISIDVTQTENSAYGNLLGDLLVVLIGSEYFFWEVYPNPYITFPVRTSDFNEGQINVQYPTTFTVQNEWDSVQTMMFVSVYQNEKQLTPSVPYINVTSANITSLTFGITEFCSGTVYDFGVTNNEVSITPYMALSNVTNFLTSETVYSVLKLNEYTYYLTSEEMILINNSNPQERHFLPIVGPYPCSLYIDDTECFGVATCGGSLTNQGFIPFTLTDLFTLPCPFLPIPSIQDTFIDGPSGILFLLMQAENGGNSNISVYNITNDICLTNQPISVLQGWSLSDTNPNFQEFDVLIMYSIAQATQVIYTIFVLDQNFGLQIISYASLTNLVAGVNSYSFTEMYQYFEPMQGPPQFLNIQLLQNECFRVSSNSSCLASLLLVANNFHTILLQFTLSNSGLEISDPESTVFLVPSDYWIDDYQVENDLLILIGRNMTDNNPSEDMLAYNISGGSGLINGVNFSDQATYCAPMWKATLIADPSEYPIDQLFHPTISLNNIGDLYVLDFPNMQNQSTISYNITNNITLSWSAEALEGGQVNLVFSNNFQEVVLPVMLAQVKAAAPVAQITSSWETYVMMGCGGLVILILILFVVWYCRRSYRRQKILYSRKLQKDPLRELII